MAYNVGNDPFEVGLLTISFRSNLELLLQQKVSLLRGYVDSAVYQGKAASIGQQIGVLEAKAPQGRYSPLVPQVPQYRRPWVFPNDRSIAVLVDQFDELRSIVDVKGGISQATAAAIGRYFDDLIINAANASVTIGVDPSDFSTESFDSTNALVADTFGASASTGMTWPKAVEARRIMRHNQVDLQAERPCLMLSSQQESDLSKQQEVINRDYQVGMVSADGNISRIGPFDVVFTERLNTSSSNTLRNCFAFVKSGIHLGIWKDMQTYIDNRADLESRPFQLYSMVSAGATRTLQFKVVQINCADTTGVDPTAP